MAVGTPEETVPVTVVDSAVASELVAITAMLVARAVPMAVVTTATRAATAAGTLAAIMAEPRAPTMAAEAAASMVVEAAASMAVEAAASMAVEADMAVEAADAGNRVLPPERSRACSSERVLLFRSPLIFQKGFLRKSPRARAIAMAAMRSAASG
jgi:hypothetical protein